MEDNEDLIFSDGGDTQNIVVIPQEIRKITTQAYDKSVSDLMRMIEERDIILDPEFQRNYIWDNKKASMLIESIILNVPIPVIYVSQEADDSWMVIDGLQRLFSLKRFFDGKFKLSGLEVLTELNKQDIKTLNVRAARMLKNGLLRVIMITHDSNEDIKYDVFMRLNTGSVHLTEQELRNCLYRGSFNKLLKDLSQDAGWLSLLGLREPHKRMADREMILRFFALKKNWNTETQVVDGYKGRMKTFLNNFMNDNKNISQDTYDKYKSLFEDSIAKTIEIFGEGAFKRLSSDGNPERSINRAVADAILISLSMYDRNMLLGKKDEIKSAFYALIAENVNFKNSLLLSTSDTKMLNTRLQMWTTRINEILR